jgi:hypothetical protein
VAGGHSDTQNGRVESVRLKQLSVFRYLRQPHSATTLKKWRGEESPSVLRRRGCQNQLLTWVFYQFSVALVRLNSGNFAILTHGLLAFVVQPCRRLATF